MKKHILLTILAFLLFNASQAQYLSYQEVVEVPDLSATQIISKADAWAGSSFNNYQKVFQFKDSTTLVLNGGFKLLMQMGIYSFPNFMTYQLKIESKQGRYRITADNIRQSNDQMPTPMQITTREQALKSYEHVKMGERMKKKAYDSTVKQYDDIDAHFASLFQSVKEAMQKSPKKDDW